MRRMITTVILTALVLAAVGGYLIVATVATAIVGGVVGALAEIGAAISTLMIILAIPVIVMVAWVLSVADWTTCVALLWSLLRLLGWQ
jgi:hypothetical protein